MANIVYFEIPADDIDRAKNFYHSLLGRKIEPNKVSIPDMASMKYQDLIRRTKRSRSYGYGQSQRGWNVYAADE